MAKKRKIDPLQDLARVHDWLTQDCEYQVENEVKSKDGDRFHGVFIDGSEGEVIASGDGPGRGWLHATTYQRVYPVLIRAAGMGQTH